MEHARNVLGWTDARHAEYGDGSGPAVVTQLACSLADDVIEVRFDPASRVAALCGDEAARERTTCHYGVNPRYQAALHEAGLRVAGTDATGEARVVELTGHPFYVASLYLPQFAPPQRQPHPLLVGFVRAVGGTA